MPSLPGFAFAPDRVTALGPYIHHDVTMHSFCVPGDRAKIGTFLDQLFKIPSGGVVSYEPLISQLFLSFARIPRVRAGGADAGRGVVPEVDVALWALARRAGTLTEWRWIPLFLFVDNAPAMATGREVYGFPKQIGRARFPMTAPSAGPFSVSTLVMDPFATSTLAGWRNVFRVEATTSPVGAELIGETAELGEAAVERLTSVASDEEKKLFDLPGLGDFLGFNVPVKMAFLKQFPDVANTSKACYQAIVEAEATPITRRGFGFTPQTYRARVRSYESHPFQQSLGLAAGWQNVGQGAWVDFDSEMKLGKVIWQAT